LESGLLRKLRAQVQAAQTFNSAYCATQTFDEASRSGHSLADSDEAMTERGEATMRFATTKGSLDSTTWL